MNDLNAYLNDKQYTLPSLALDLVLYAMSNVTVCTVNVYYYTQSKLKKHKFEPSNIYPVNNIDLVHWKGHYDLVTGKIIELKEPPKAQRSSSEVITIGDSPCKIELDVSKVKAENQMQIKKEILTDSLFPPSETLCFPESADLPDIESDGEDVEMIEYRGYKKYINPLIFQNTPVQVAGQELSKYPRYWSK